MSDTDRAELLRITIIEGDIPGREAGYTVTIVGSPQAIDGRSQKPEVLLLAVRSQRMHAVNSPHLAGFKTAYQLAPQYNLLAGRLTAGGQLLLLPNLLIRRKSVVFRTVKEVGKMDLDAAIFLPQKDRFDSTSPSSPWNVH